MNPNLVRLGITVFNTAAWFILFSWFGTPREIVWLISIIVFGVTIGGLSLAAVTERQNGIH